ncbi:ATP-binding protein [Patescibacteria group bacterium]|nr:ATP-binding protein [Patescibacteria group bacterium]
MFLKTLVLGYEGSGKSTYLLSHPKIAWLLTEPGSEILLEAMPEYKQNVVWMEQFIPSPSEDIKDVFKRLDAAVLRAHTEAKEGKIETIGLDNMTYLSANRFMYIEKYEKTFGKSGEINTQAMYGSLGRWLYQFTLTNILSFPGHVVVTCHEQMESEDALEAKTDKTTPIVPNITGGFREKIGGMFSAVIYLDKQRIGENKYKYVARCQKGNMRLAKNRYGLPEIVENVNYQSIMEAINKNKQKEVVK